MKSNLINDDTIRKLIINIEDSPPNSLKKVKNEFNFKKISMDISEPTDCKNIVGIDGSVKLITDRISYYNFQTKRYQTHIIDPIIFLRTASVNSIAPFIKDDKITIIERLDQFYLKNTDRQNSITRIESEQLQLMEIEHINKTIENMSYGDILLLDMALHRKQYGSEIKEIINKCQFKGINVIGWAKDSDIRTTQGLSYTDAARIIASYNDIKPPWYSNHPYFDNVNIKVLLYRPPWSSFCFRIDVVPSSLTINQIFNELIKCSKNSLGYPLVLYKAHQKVKITQNHADNLFRKMRKIAASEGIFIDLTGVKPFHERYLDI